MIVDSNASKNNSCCHPRRRVYRKPFASGSGFHLVELCTDCGQPTRPPSVWVRRREALEMGHDDLDNLPIAPERSSSPAQPNLFDVNLEDL